MKEQAIIFSVSVLVATVILAYKLIVAFRKFNSNRRDVKKYEEFLRKFK